jgi:hypothetical protein
MREHGTRPTGKDRRHPPAQGSQWREVEHASMHAAEAAARDTGAHGVRAHPERRQLREREHAVLECRDATDLSFPLTAGDLRQVSRRNWPDALHAAMLSARAARFNARL